MANFVTKDISIDLISSVDTTALIGEFLTSFVIDGTIPMETMGEQIRKLQANLMLAFNSAKVKFEWASEAAFAYNTSIAINTKTYEVSIDTEVVKTAKILVLSYSGNTFARVTVKDKLVAFDAGVKTYNILGIDWKTLLDTSCSTIVE